MTNEPALIIGGTTLAFGAAATAGEKLATGEWSEFGLIGMVVGSVMTLGFYVVRWTLNQTAQTQQDHKSEREAWRTDVTKLATTHAEERRDWQQSQAARDQRMDEALTALTEAIHIAGGKG